MVDNKQPIDFVALLHHPVDFMALLDQEWIWLYKTNNRFNTFLKQNLKAIPLHHFYEGFLERNRRTPQAGLIFILKNKFELMDKMINLMVKLLKRYESDFTRFFCFLNDMKLNPCVENVLKSYLQLMQNQPLYSRWSSFTPFSQLIGWLARFKPF